MKYDGRQVPLKVISEEISAEKWDMIGIGGLTTTYGRIKEIAPLIRKLSPDSLFVSGGGWCSYNPDEIVLGKRMEDQLRFAVAWWHSFAWEGGDPFGGATFIRPWHPQDNMERARLKACLLYTSDAADE